MPSRRLTTVAAGLLGVLAAASLAGCNNSPNVAAYVGSTQFTEARVTKIYDDAQTSLEKYVQDQYAKQGLPAPTAAVVSSTTRQEIVGTLVLGAICAKAQEEQHFTAASVTADEIAQARNQTAPALAPDSEFAKLEAATLGCIYGMPAVAAPLTDAEKHEFFDAGDAGGLFNGASYDEVIPQLTSAQLQQLQAAFAHRNLLAQSVAASKVSVNPRYRALQYPLLAVSTSGPVLVGVSLGQPANDAVTTVPQPSASASATA